MKSGLFTTAAALLAAVFMLSAHAQNGKMYSYKDENGTIVFTDQPPQDRNVQSQDIPGGQPPQGDNPYADAGAEAVPSAAQQRREEITRDRREARLAQAERESQCAAWQAEVERLEPHRRHFYENDKGETVRMDDVERVNRVADLKQKIAADCS